MRTERQLTRLGPHPRADHWATPVSCPRGRRMALASARNSISRRFDTAQRVFTRQSRPFPELKVSQIAFQTLRLISCLIELNLIVIKFYLSLFFLNGENS